jgi:thiol-disulfide isomerase/thioredoxin
MLAALLLAMTLGCSDGGSSPGNGRSLAPDFRLNTLDGQQVQLSDYRGKVVLIHFWATWCEPCLEAIPY